VAFLWGSRDIPLISRSDLVFFTASINEGSVPSAHVLQQRLLHAVRQPNPVVSTLDSIMSATCHNHLHNATLFSRENNTV
jgi:hypothetical protein